MRTIQDLTTAVKIDELMNMYSYIGLIAAVVMMLFFIPAQDSVWLNAVIGAICGVAGATVGGVLGIMIKKISL